MDGKRWPAPREATKIRVSVAWLEVLSLLALLGLALLALWRLGFGSVRMLAGLGMALLGLGLGAALGPARRAAGSGMPIRIERRSGYASSDACRSCHPSEHASWHQSFHRSMTQAADVASVRAPWDEVLGWRGRSYRLFRKGDEFWVRLPDPDRTAALTQAGLEPDATDVDRRIVMTTGSHHYQAYWVPGSRGNELWQFPFVYHFESQRFIPRHDVFLQPEQDPQHVARWNSNCIQCHSVAGEPRHDLASDRFDSRVVELGIACEACHGPGAEHAARERDPFLRWRQRPGDVAPSIVNPARLDARRASEVCGQCHSYFMPRDAEAWWTSGFRDRYQPGDDLNRSRRSLEYATDDPELDASLDSLFYPDGTIRVGGREWNGLARSACFERGAGERQIACTSCHQMHGVSRDDQLGPLGGGDAACRGCHADLSSEHSRHRPGSSGSECMNCHMPRTTYALFKAIRSHRISVPIADDTPGAALNACNLCHQDRSLAWAAEQLAAWKDPSPPAPARDPAGPLERGSAIGTALLAGDAAARVIAAFELGSPAARDVSGAGWQAALLVEALDDSYAAVRFVAARSLRTFAGFEDFAFDFIAPRALRLDRQAEGRARAARAAHAPGRDAVPPLPLDASGLIGRNALERLARARDDRPIRIAE